MRLQLENGVQLARVEPLTLRCAQPMETPVSISRPTAPYLSVSKIDLLFITIDRKYGDDVANGNPARALVLHEFMEALLRIAAIRHEHEPAARGLSPNHHGSRDGHSGVSESSQANHDNVLRLFEDARFGRGSRAVRGASGEHYLLAGHLREVCPLPVP